MAKLFAKSQKVKKFSTFRIFVFFDFSGRNPLDCALFDFSTFRTFRLFELFDFSNFSDFSIFSTFRAEIPWTVHFSTFRLFELFDFSNFSTFRIFRIFRFFRLFGQKSPGLCTFRLFELFYFSIFSTFWAEIAWPAHFSTFRLFDFFDFPGRVLWVFNLPSQKPTKMLYTFILYTLFFYNIS